jgi:hypothetical protein
MESELIRITDEITYHLMTHLQRGKDIIVVPNLYYRGFEMDIFTLNIKGYIHEYEIKSNYNNFLADRDKKCPAINFYHDCNPEIKMPYMVGAIKNEDIFNFRYSKHKLINDGYYGVQGFSYVCPADLIPIREIPDMYGLIYYCEKKKLFYTIKRAKHINTIEGFYDSNFYKKIFRKTSTIIFSNRQKIHRLMKNKDSKGYTKKIQ